MNLQGSSYNLQGGTGISLGNYSPQRAITLPNSAPTGIQLQGSAPAQSVQPNYSPSYQSTTSVSGPTSVPAPNWNLSSIYNQQGAQAASNINPYYNLQMQNFQQQRALQQQQSDLNLQNYQNTLQNNLQSNDISRGRDAQDALTNEQQIGQAADIRQQTQGQQFDQARIAQAKQIAGQGLTGSGLGNQQVLQSQTDRNFQESNQGTQDLQQVAAQELSKARNFEDLSNSDVLSKQAEAQGEKQVSIDLNKFIQQQNADIETSKKQQVADISAEQRRLAQQKLNQMIDALSNPYQKVAAAQAYAGRF